MAVEPETKLRDWSPSDVWRGLNKPVFIPAVIIIIAGLIFATWWGAEYGGEGFEELNNTVVETIGWWYVIITAVFVGFAFWAGLSKVGNIRLGRDDEKPEFALGSWFTMLFAAGMGIGLVFWGVAEPLWHFVAPPEATGDATSEGMATQSDMIGSAFGATAFHWGLHAWAIYVVVGLGLAYMTFRRGRPLSVRWLLEPIFGRRLIESWVGHLIDIVAITGTVFGVVTSLGFGTQQIAAGLGFMGWVEDGSDQFLLTMVVVVVMGIATISVITGVNKGLKWLSNTNMIAAACLALFVLAAGPTLFLLQSFVANIGEYIQIFPQMLFESSMDYAGSGGEGVTEDGGLLGSFSVDWTVYYWGWWMSWAPFVGMFIARISRGRTIREFVLGVLLAPTMVGLLWFSIFGGTGLWFQITEGTMVSYDDEGAAEIGTEESLFLMLEQLPIASIASVIAILIVTLFFITSGDSASLVTDVLSYGGRTETPKLTRTFWTVLIAITAIVLLSAAPDPEASMTVLQMSAIMAAAPLSIVYALAVIAMLRLLLFEGRTSSKYVRVRHHATKAAMVKAAREAAGAENGTAVQRNLLSLLNKQATSLRTLFGGASATLAGLPARSSERKLAEGVANDDLVLAIQDVPGQATTVNTETGVLGWNRELGYRDPLPDTEFDSEEYAQSYEGWESESEEFFDETVATGTIETVEPNTKPKDENSS